MISRFCRGISITAAASFILRLENETGKQAEDHGRRDPRGRGSQASRQDAERAVLVHRLFDTAGQRIAEARQRNGRARARKIDELVIQPDGTKQDARYNIGDQNARRCQLRSVDEDLTD